MSGKPNKTPSINNFAQADSLVPGGVQGYDRYAYVNNNPLIYTDPTGHLACMDDDQACIDHQQPSTQPTSVAGHTVTSQTSGFTDGYKGPLPQNVMDLLIAQGADADLVNNVVLHIDIGGCSVGQLAVTNGNDVTICQWRDTDGSAVFDQTTLTPVLVHELIHVQQFQDHPIATRVDIGVSNLLQGIDEFLQDNFNQPDRYNPYKDSWVERAGSQCQEAFKKNPNLLFDSSGACDLQ